MPLSRAREAAYLVQELLAGSLGVLDDLNRWGQGEVRFSMLPDGHLKVVCENYERLPTAVKRAAGFIVKEDWRGRPVEIFKDRVGEALPDPPATAFERISGPELF